MNAKKNKEYISSIIGNPHLAESIYDSLILAAEHPSIFSEIKSSAKRSFDLILDNSIRDIENHPRGKLFQRLIEFGPLNPDETDLSKYPSETFLCDDECISAVNFIYNHIINRFKGDLAELLSIEPLLTLMDSLVKQKIISDKSILCLGDYIKEYQKSGNLSKGADGLIIELEKSNQTATIKAVIEVKSMHLPESKMIKQIDKHIYRLRTGLKLGDQVYSGAKVLFNENDIIKVMVKPSIWQVNRKIGWNGNRMILPEPDKAPEKKSKIEGLNPYDITLSWSQEAIEQAAYEMTFNYMAEVGRAVYGSKPLPVEWEDMSPEEAGYNSIKEKLYYMMQSYHYKPKDGEIKLTEKQRDKKVKMIKLYNIYSFGYAIGIDSKVMLWPEDFKK